LYVIDANVLIDYRDSDLSILSIFSMTQGQIYVPSLIADEVTGISQGELEAHNLVIYEPKIGDLFNAYEKKGGLSVRDHLFLILATKNNWICITNEKLLGNECQRNGLETIRGLRILINLCQQGYITANYAELIAQKIHQTNPFHISEDVIQKFYQEIGLEVSG
jgi:rRNA-processing protein FCF1